MTQKKQLTQVIQIVPQLPPAINGLGDYALNLACQMRKQYGIETQFVVGDPSWQGTAAIEDFAIQQVGACSAEALSLLPTSSNQDICEPNSIVLLHYVGYGYAKRGSPVWLVEGLERWKTGTVNAHLVTMFHELYAFGPPWTSSFWLSPLQRHLAARLAQLSDRCLTSTNNYANSLHKLSKRKQSHIPTLPVFSNIGESEQVLPLAERARKLVVFGSSANRVIVYQNALTELSYACQVIGIEEVVDIGPPIESLPSAIAGVPVVEMGQLPASKIGDIFLHSLAGFFDYLPGRLAKSTIFAAYCAYGLLPVSARYNPSSSDGIEAGQHYWIPEERTTEQELIDELQAIADNARAWYQTHNLSVQAQVFVEQLSRSN